MEASQNNGTRFREKEVTAFGSDDFVCYQRGVGGASVWILLFRHVLTHTTHTPRHAVKREKARFDGSDMFCRPRKK